jgi:hypothetical protein
MSDEWFRYYSQTIGAGRGIEIEIEIQPLVTHISRYYLYIVMLGANFSGSILLSTEVNNTNNKL